jgi:hypothetical protein
MYGRGLMIYFNEMVYFLVLSLMFEVKIYGYALMLMLHYTFIV